MEEQKQYTVSVFTENKIGLLNRLTVIFTRRHMNIDSLTTSDSEIKGIHRFTIVTTTTRSQIQKVVKQIEKQIGVLKCFFYEDKDIIYQEIALYKVMVSSFESGELEQIIRHNHACILTIESEFMVIEQTGHNEEIQSLFKELEPYGVLSFVRSGRIAIAKPMKRLNAYLKELEAITVE